MRHFFILSIRMSAMLFSRYHHIFEIFRKLNMFWSSILTHTGYWAMGRFRSLIGYVSPEAVEKTTGVVLPKGGPGCSLAEASCLRTLWFGYAVGCVCGGPSSAVLLPTDWVWGTGQTASIVSFCLCKIGKFTLLGRAVMEIKYSHTYKKYFFQFEGGSRSIPTDAESGPCFRIGCHNVMVEKKKVCAMVWPSPS